MSACSGRVTPGFVEGERSAVMRRTAPIGLVQAAQMDQQNAPFSIDAGVSYRQQLQPSCNVCKKWATRDHMMSKRHTKRSRISSTTPRTTSLRTESFQLYAEDVSLPIVRTREPSANDFHLCFSTLASVCDSCIRDGVHFESDLLGSAASRACLHGIHASVRS